jgi:putative MFS transporter
MFGLNRQNLGVVVAASLGYLVDLFDTFLTPALRGPSLHDLGVATAASLQVGTNVFNFQLLGQTLGALMVWGPLADRFGRKKVLFGSIVLYGIGNFATAYAHGLASFTLMRFIAGLGLGGELGAGIALISETMEPEHRTNGTAIVGFFGMLGVVLAGLIAKATWLSWRTDYKIGGLVALIVLLTRIATSESVIFERAVANSRPAYWRILEFLARPRNLAKLAACVLVGAPTFFVVGLLVTGAPEFGSALGMQVLPKSPDALIWTYSSIAVGGIACGLFAQQVRSRKVALLVFHLITLGGFASLLFLPAVTPLGYYVRCAVTGLGIGYWANMVTNAAEQWGTNVRGTVTIAVPNVVRLLLFPISLGFAYLKPGSGYIASAAIVGFVCSAAAIGSVIVLQDGFHRNLDFVEDLSA